MRREDAIADCDFHVAARGSLGQIYMNGIAILNDHPSAGFGRQIFLVIDFKQDLSRDEQLAQGQVTVVGHGFQRGLIGVDPQVFEERRIDPAGERAVGVLDHFADVMAENP